MPKINLEEILKGSIIALVLMVGMALGSLLNSQDVNGWVIWFVVSVINIGAAIFTVIFIKKELNKKPEQVAPATESDKKSTKKKKDSSSKDKHEAESSTQNFETAADKKE